MIKFIKSWVKDSVNSYSVAGDVAFVLASMTTFLAAVVAWIAWAFKDVPAAEVLLKMLPVVIPYLVSAAVYYVYEYRGREDE